MNGPRKQLYVKSFGCQMNVYDSRRMADTLAPQGYVERGTAEDADLIILNTCHIREKAAEKVYSELGRVRRMKEAAAAEGRRVVVAVAGCVAQAEGEEIIRRAQPSIWCSARRAITACPICWRAPRATARRSIPSFRSTTNSITSPRRAAPRSARAASSAFVTVQEGCDKFCTFCVVPYTRGAEMSRPAQQDPCRDRAAGRRRRARDHADRPERQCLSWRGTGRAAVVAGAAPRTRRRDRRASSGCATPPVIRATWTTI